MRQTNNVLKIRWNKNSLTFLFLFISASLWGREYNIVGYGAQPDTSVLSTAAIQKAIDECNLQGGGRVIVPSGRYKTGSLILKSNVEFHLENGAILYGSKKLDDYIKLKPAYISLRTQEATIQLIYAENAKNVSITGQGEIDGQGSTFKKMNWNDEGITRPHLLRFITCTNVIVENITLKNSGCWMQHYLACEKVQIRGVKVFNRNNFNNDGLDLDGCRNVTVSDFISDSDDDGITLKSTSPKPCENITITNCIISSRCNAIKLGTESNGGFRNINISNCIVEPSEIPDPAFYGDRIGISGVSLEIVDGGVMEGISVSNILIDGTKSPLFVRLGNRARPFKQDTPVTQIGQIENISISNIRVKNAGKIGCSVTGLPGHPVKDIRFNDIVIEQMGDGAADDVFRKIEEKPEDYPSATMFGVLPAHGFFIRHASNISFDGVRLVNKELDYRPSFYLEDVRGGNFSNMEMQCPKGSVATILINESSDLTLKNNVGKGMPDCFVKLEDHVSQVQVINNVIKEGVPVYKSGAGAKGIIEQGNTRLKSSSF